MALCSMIVWSFYWQAPGSLEGLPTFRLPVETWRNHLPRQQPDRHAADFAGISWPLPGFYLLEDWDFLKRLAPSCDEAQDLSSKKKPWATSWNLTQLSRNQFSALQVIFHPGVGNCCISKVSFNGKVNWLPTKSSWSNIGGFPAFLSTPGWFSWKVLWPQSITSAFGAWDSHLQIPALGQFFRPSLVSRYPNSSGTWPQNHADGVFQSKVVQRLSNLHRGFKKQPPAEAYNMLQELNAWYVWSLVFICLSTGPPWRIYVRQFQQPLVTVEHKIWHSTRNPQKMRTGTA